MKCLQRSATRLVIPFDGSVNFCEKNCDYREGTLTCPLKGCSFLSGCLVGPWPMESVLTEEPLPPFLNIPRPVCTLCSNRPTRSHLNKHQTSYRNQWILAGLPVMGSDAEGQGSWSAFAFLVPCSFGIYILGRQSASCFLYIHCQVHWHKGLFHRATKYDEIGR